MGKALFDDVVAYAGFYHPEADTIAATETASLKAAEIDISDFVTQGGDAVSASLTYNEIYTYKAFVWSEDLNPLNVNCVYSSGY